ncbi:MAG: hypothetical protein HZA52_07740 [Planctomycetes bacterium]|nr:hypothetical protein [Planctomycetota bacterium]
MADALRAAGATVEIHDDHFASDTADEEWIREVGARGWIVLTRDERIRYRPLERRAVVEARVRLFCVTGGRMKGADMAAVLTHQLRKLENVSRSEPAPFIARVTRSRVLVSRLRR